MSARPLRRIALAASVAALAAPHPAGAQPAAASNQQCERSLRQVDSAPEEVMTRGALHMCGDRGAAALATLVRRAAHRTDDTYWTTLFWATETPLQPVLDAAADLARDRTAPVPNRIRGLVLLAHQVYGPNVQLMAPGGRIDSLPSADYCLFTAMGDGGPLKEQVGVLEELVKTLSDDRTEPLGLRLAALCIVRHYRHGYQLVEDPSRIHIIAECERRYRARSDLDHQILIEWDVVGTKAKGSVFVSANAEKQFFTDAPGVARFYTGDELIAAVPNSPRSCATER